MKALPALGAIAIGCVGIVGAALIAARVDPMAYTGGRARDDEERLQRNSSAIATMLGEFRTSMSDIMFIKTERYLHGGVAYRPHHDEAVLSAGDLAEEVAEHQSELTLSPIDDTHRHDHHTHDDHVGTATLIPAAERDFRGIIGRLHRAVKPWRDPDKPHIHSDGRELTPWFRLMTTTDPRYVRGYVAGAFWLQTVSQEAAMAFVEEGLEHNPDAFQLLVSRGLLRVREARRLGDITADTLDPSVHAMLERARADFLQAARLALAQRPVAVLETGEVWQPGWGPYLEDDAARACHMAVMLTRTLIGDARARELAARFVGHFPDHLQLQNSLR